MGWGVLSGGCTSTGDVLCYVVTVRRFPSRPLMHVFRMQNDFLLCSPRALQYIDLGPLLRTANIPVCNVLCTQMEQACRQGTPTVSLRVLSQAESVPYGREAQQGKGGNSALKPTSQLPQLRHQLPASNAMFPHTSLRGPCSTLHPAY